MIALNWWRVTIVILWSGVLLFAHILVFDHVGIGAHVANLGALASVAAWYGGAFLAIAAPIYWYFLTEQGAAATGAVIGLLVALGLWSIDVGLQLPKAFWDFALDLGPSVSWEFGNLLLASPICGSIGALVGWMANRFDSVADVQI